MTLDADLAIVGAGPAGMAAAATAAELGLRVTVLDEQPEPGGQIYRGIEGLAATRPRHLDWLGPDYAAGLALAQAFRSARLDYLSGAQVWQVEAGRRVFYKRAGAAGIVTAGKILIATGAMERPFPVPGWTLPGVLTCGAAQTLLKANGLAPQGRFVLAGSGPLLLLLTAQLVRAGVRPAALLETSLHRFAALPHLAGMLVAPHLLMKGLALLREIRASGIPYHRGVTRLAIEGSDRAREIEFIAGGTMHRLPVDLVFLHQGVVPNANLGFSAALAHDWDATQRCYRPRLDLWGRSSAPSVMVAGDAGGIVGAEGAALMGRLCAYAAASDLGRISEAECAKRAREVRKALARLRAARPFLDALYRPEQRWIAPPDPQTIVCRCEEVRAGEIRRLVTEQQCPGPNQMKAFVRCGMGPCQGRLCGLTVVEMIAESRGVPVAEVGYYRIRPPVKPVTLGDMATLDVPARHEAVNP
jgi:NADPH-dependent 2,4-dienoyl-CoA reductase/sulfur reductase-like enzyme